MTTHKNQSRNYSLNPTKLMGLQMKNKNQHSIKACKISKMPQTAYKNPGCNSK
jgi:hypothetical protein